MEAIKPMKTRVYNEKSVVLPRKYKRVDTIDDAEVCLLEKYANQEFGRTAPANERTDKPVVYSLYALNVYQEAQKLTSDNRGRMLTKNRLVSKLYNRRKRVGFWIMSTGHRKKSCYGFTKKLERCGGKWV